MVKREGEVQRGLEASEGEEYVSVVFTWHKIRIGGRFCD